MVLIVTAFAFLALSAVQASPTGTNGAAQRPIPNAFAGFEPTTALAGVVTRVALNGRHEAKKLLGIVEAREYDLWQITPTYADVFSPSSFPPNLQDGLSNYTTISSHPILRPVASAHTQFFDYFGQGGVANSTFHDAYHPLAEVDEFMFDLAGNYSDRAHLLNLGHTGEGKELYALKISNGGLSLDFEDEVKVDSERRCITTRRGKKARGGKKPKPRVPTGGARPGIVIFGPQHAREWIGTATALYLSHALLANSSEPGSLAPLLDTHDFYIVPSPNPDGYAYTWEHDRFWYKNRQVIGPYEKCVGLDMNRNWGYKWKKAAKAGLKDSGLTDPCSHWYPGRRAFEAPETNNLANFVEALPNVVAFLELRSYGQMVSSPFSYSCKKTPPDAEDQLELASGAAHAAQKTHGTWFTTGQLCFQLYRAGGNVVDYMYAKAGIKYSYAIHLRDTGTFGFALPPQWIRPVGEETAEMVRYLAKFIHNKGF
jgi:hypothetical protein